MQVLFESRHPQAAQLRDLAFERVRFVMRRLTWLVPRARVQFSDINGPRGGLDKRCKVEIQTETNGSVVVTSVARDWRSALDQALARASRALLRAWRRSRAHARPHPRVMANHH
jgi:hypothetical protein